jgi:Gpi18-like mannosyltransferase
MEPVIRSSEYDPTLDDCLLYRLTVGVLHQMCAYCATFQSHCCQKMENLEQFLIELVPIYLIDLIIEVKLKISKKKADEFQKVAALIKQLIGELNASCPSQKYGIFEKVMRRVIFEQENSKLSTDFMQDVLE